MAHMARPGFEGFDQSIADAFLRASEQVGGLPGWLGVRITDIGPGRLVAEMAVRADLLTPFGTLHGGVMAGLVDHVLGCVLYPLMARGQWAATTEFKLNYLAPVRGGVLRAASTVVTLGRRTAVVLVEVTNGDAPVCVAQGTLLVSEPPKRSE
jgi:1,4-dihydroxy-2-naphthoyl-CoA hydrolase